MSFTRGDIRESIERAGDEHWEALVRHHTDVHPESNPTPGDVCRAEAERLNGLGFGDKPDLGMVKSCVERVPPAVRMTHVLEDREHGSRFETWSGEQRRVGRSTLRERGSPAVPRTRDRAWEGAVAPVSGCGLVRLAEQLGDQLVRLLAASGRESL